MREEQGGREDLLARQEKRGGQEEQSVERTESQIMLLNKLRRLTTSSW